MSKLILALLGVLALAAHAKSEYGDSSEVKNEMFDFKPRQPSIWNKICRAPIVAVSAIYGLGSAFLPQCIKTTLGYATLPFTWGCGKICSKVMGWNNILEFLADESSTLRWLTTGVGLGSMCGFSDREVCDTETRFISKAILLAKERVLAKKNGGTYSADKEKVYNDHMKSLYTKLKTPKSFTLNAASYLVTYIRMLPGVGDSPYFTTEYVEFFCSHGMHHLTVNNLKAVMYLLIQACYGDLIKSQSKSDPNELDIDTEQMTQMGFAMSLCQKVMADYERHEAEKKAAEERRKRNDGVPTPIKIAATDPNAKPYVKPLEKLEDTEASKNRKDTNFWVFVMVFSLLIVLAGVAYAIGMGRPPVSQYPIYLGEDPSRMGSPRPVYADQNGNVLQGSQLV